MYDKHLIDPALCGIDEAGRGPLAGPVCAAAVVLPTDFPADCLNDSKKLSRQKREKAEAIILEQAFWGIGWASHQEIDNSTIVQATLLAMKRAFEALVRKHTGILVEEVVVDGLDVPAINARARALVKADSLVAAVMAASILAKQARDTVMDDYARLYPQYGFDSHRGYPTKAHLEKLYLFGPSPIQRKTFSIKARQGLLF
jgi:ribonuclease HII